MQSDMPKCASDHDYHMYPVGVERLVDEDVISLSVQSYFSIPLLTVRFFLSFQGVSCAVVDLQA